MPSLGHHSRNSVSVVVQDYPRFPYHTRPHVDRSIDVAAVEEEVVVADHSCYGPCVSPCVDAAHFVLSSYFHSVGVHYRHLRVCDPSDATDRRNYSGYSGLSTSTSHRNLMPISQYSLFHKIVGDHVVRCATPEGEADSSVSPCSWERTETADGVVEADDNLHQPDLGDSLHEKGFCHCGCCNYCDYFVDYCSSRRWGHDQVLASSWVNMAD